MKRSRLPLLSLTAILIGFGAQSAFAEVFNTTGSQVSGRATFSFGSGTLNLTLENTTAHLAAIVQVLDGLEFNVAGISNLTLTSVTGSGFERCTGNGNNTTCQSITAAQQNLGTSPYGWALSGSYLLLAGSGSYKPGGIVNTGITGADGLGNAEHNDYLIGPVTFAFTYTGTAGHVTGVQFDWGTNPDTTAGVCTSGCTPTVPDGGTTASLLGFVLALGGLAMRRFR